ncbi:MAG TPA: hypothetical protein VH643_08250 [Gemmataceae bacterium]|jgi:hypothetical protein
MSRNKVRIGVLLVLLAGIGTIVPAGGQEISQKKDAGDEKPAAKVDPAVIAQLIAQLGSDNFQTREKAHRQLAKSVRKK